VQGVIDFVKRAWDDIEGLGATVVRDVGGFLVDDNGLLDALMADVLEQVPH
jgi:hypothetical protein